MMNRMVVANLVHRPIRSVISIVAIALEVTLILLIVGLCYGIMNDSKNRTAGIGADVIVQPPGSSFLAGISGAPVSVKIADILRRMPHVKVVSPVVWQIVTGAVWKSLTASTCPASKHLADPSSICKAARFKGQMT